jgi:hypothetical protein
MWLLFFLRFSENFKLFINLLLQLSEAAIPRLHVKLKRVEVPSRDLAHQLTILAGLSIDHTLNLLLEESEVALRDVEDLGEQGAADDVRVLSLLVQENLVRVVTREVEAEPQTQEDQRVVGVF